MKKSLFTLIELLVVIAILGILLTLLMPSLRNSRTQARVAVCASNMKQIGFAFMNYTSRNNGQIPINLSLGNGNEMTWDDYLAEYDGREVPQNNLTGWIPHEFNFDQYICPADKSEESNRHKRSYAITLGAADSTRTSKRGIAAATGSGWSMNIMRINFPRDTIAIAERHDKSNSLGCNGGAVIRSSVMQSERMTEDFWGHRMWKSNYLFLDSSVRYLSAESTFKGERSIWGSSNQTDTMWDSRR